MINLQIIQSFHHLTSNLCVSFSLKWVFYRQHIVISLCPTLFVTSCTVAYQVPLPMGLPRQEFSSGLPFSSPEDLPDPRIEAVSLSLQERSCLFLSFFTDEPPGKSTMGCYSIIKGNEGVSFAKTWM